MRTPSRPHLPLLLALAGLTGLGAAAPARAGTHCGPPIGGPAEYRCCDDAALAVAFPGAGKVAALPRSLKEDDDEWCGSASDLARVSGPSGPTGCAFEAGSAGSGASGPARGYLIRCRTRPLPGHASVTGAACPDPNAPAAPARQGFDPIGAVRGFFGGIFGGGRKAAPAPASEPVRPPGTLDRAQCLAEIRRRKDAGTLTRLRSLDDLGCPKGFDDPCAADLILDAVAGDVGLPPAEVPEFALFLKSVASLESGNNWRMRDASGKIIERYNKRSRTYDRGIFQINTQVFNNPGLLSWWNDYLGVGPAYGTPDAYGEGNSGDPKRAPASTQKRVYDLVSTDLLAHIKFSGKRIANLMANWIRPKSRKPPNPRDLPWEWDTDRVELETYSIYNGGIPIIDQFNLGENLDRSRVPRGQPPFVRYSEEQMLAQYKGRSPAKARAVYYTTWNVWNSYLSKAKAARGDPARMPWASQLQGCR